MAALMEDHGTQSHHGSVIYLEKITVTPVMRLKGSVSGYQDTISIYCLKSKEKKQSIISITILKLFVCNQASSSINISKTTIIL